MKSGVMAIVFLAISPVFAVAAGPWAAFNVGYGTYSMSDLNDQLRFINNFGGLSIDEINGGLNVDLTAGYQFVSGLGLGLGYGRLNGSTSYSDPTGILEINVPANVFKALIEYHLESKSKADLYFRGEVGSISATGDALLTDGINRLTTDYEGSSLFLAGIFGVGIPMSTSVGIHGQLGYRMANIDPVKDNGTLPFQNDGSPMTHDYSGFLIRVGVRVHFAGGGGA